MTFKIPFATKLQTHYCYVTEIQHYLSMYFPYSTTLKSIEIFIDHFILDIIFVDARYRTPRLTFFHTLFKDV